MRTTVPPPQPKAAGLSVPLEVPLPPVARPVRRGHFWPGESFGTCTRKWDLSGALGDQAFVLPALAGPSNRKP